jgi:hypothetical protein
MLLNGRFITDFIMLKARNDKLFLTFKPPARVRIYPICEFDLLLLLAPSR